jgi:hypothetical protein
MVILHEKYQTTMEFLGLHFGIDVEGLQYEILATINNALS